MNIKKHFKLYKSGKKWCCAAIVLASLVLGATTAKAADVTVKSPESTVNVMEVNQSSSAATDSQAAVTQQNEDNLKTTDVTSVKSPDQSTSTTNGISTTGQPNTFNTVNNNVYYYGNDGKLYQNQWYQNWGHKYYFGADGARYTNKLADIDQATYYFDNQGIMATNLFQQRNGKLYYFGADGQEYKDRFYNNWGHTYYFGLDGARYTNQFYNNWGHTYYFGADGARWDNRFMNAWGHTYYFGSDGARWDNRWMNAWNQWYYFLGDGVRATSQTADIDGSTYFFNNQGVMQRDYFLNKNGKVYYFGADGREYKNRFYNNWGHTYYFGADGARYTNQFYNNWGNTYYFGADGARWDNRWMNAWGNRYYFKWDGARATSEYFAVNGQTYYFDDQGIAHDDPLVTRWKSLISGYNGHHIMVALQSQKTGAIHEYTNTPGYRLPTASTVKVAVLAQLLHNTNGNLTAYQRDLASKMIRNSDNAATTTLINRYLGGTNGMRAIYSALGMNQTTPGTNNYWGLTQTTATDQLKLLNEIFIKPHSSYLNDNSRNYIKSLMSTVSPEQNWGISAGSSQFYVKNGWLALSAPWPWFVNSIGFIPQSGNNGYSMAVFTDKNIPMQVGVNMIQSLARATKNYI